MQDKKPNQPMVQDIIYNPVGIFPWDPLGSYTGRPQEPDEKPVQDADDL